MLVFLKERVYANMKEVLRRAFILFDYFLWLLFDFSKFTIIRKERIKKVVVIHSGAIGEILVTTPILKALKENLHAEITFMLKEGREDVLKYNSYVDHFIFIPRKFKDKLELLKDGEYDLAVILWPGSLSFTFACFRAHIPYRIGCFKMLKEGPAFFFTRRWFPLQHKHAVQSNLDMIRLIGIDNKNPKLEFYFSKNDEKNINKFIKRKRIGNFIILHPGFGSFKKRLWPIERYAHVSDALIKKYNMKIVITGVKDELSLAQDIYEKSKYKKNIIITNSMFNLNELGALVKRSKLVIAPDTSIIHIASAVQTPVIDLVSRGNTPVEWVPWMDSKKYRVIFHTLGFNRFEREYSEAISQKCLEAINEKEVIAVADSLL